MLLLSAFESFVQKTLSTIPTHLERVEYIGELRDQELYRHWGLSRMYGEQASADAISQAHSEVWIEVLRTPLESLVEEMAALGEDHEQLIERVAGWLQAESRLTPADLRGGNQAHFNSILLTLSLLSQAAKAKSRPTA